IHSTSGITLDNHTYCTILNQTNTLLTTTNMLTTFYESYNELWRNGDPRVTDWPLMQTPLPTIVICLLYVFTVKYVGPRLMRHRPPFEIRNLMLIYNFTMVLASFYLFYRLGKHGWFGKYNLKCQPVDYSSHPDAIGMADIAWWYYISKFVEFLDTIFFVIRKKTAHISTLHVIHHGIMPMSVWWGVKFTPGGHSTFFAFINSFVHVLMYTYYGIAAIGPHMYKYLWWKRYMTALQMIQFVIIFVHSFQLLFRACNYPRGFMWFIGFHAIMFWFLFMNFYKLEYKHRRDKQQKAAVAAAASSAVANTNDINGDKRQTEEEEEALINISNNSNLHRRAVYNRMKNNSNNNNSINNHHVKSPNFTNNNNDTDVNFNYSNNNFTPNNHKNTALHDTDVIENHLRLRREGTDSISQSRNALAEGDDDVAASATNEEEADPGSRSEEVSAATESPVMISPAAPGGEEGNIGDEDGDEDAESRGVLQDIAKNIAKTVLNGAVTAGGALVSANLPMVAPAAKIVGDLVKNGGNNIIDTLIDATNSFKLLGGLDKVGGGGGGGDGGGGGGNDSGGDDDSGDDDGGESRAAIDGLDEDLANSGGGEDGDSRASDMAADVASAGDATQNASSAEAGNDAQSRGIFSDIVHTIFPSGFNGAQTTTAPLTESESQALEKVSTLSVPLAALSTLNSYTLSRLIKAAKDASSGCVRPTSTPSPLKTTSKPLIKNTMTPRQESTPALTTNKPSKTTTTAKSDVSTTVKSRTWTTRAHRKRTTTTEEPTTTRRPHHRKRTSPVAELAKSISRKVSDAHETASDIKNTVVGGGDEKDKKKDDKDEKSFLTDPLGVVEDSMKDGAKAVADKIIEQGVETAKDQASTKLMNPMINIAGKKLKKDAHEAINKINEPTKEEKKAQKETEKKAKEAEKQRQKDENEARKRDIEAEKKAKEAEEQKS
ncbi:Elongation of very long chain fatty acids protein, partial [Fragariocoptes setiger]